MCILIVKRGSNKLPKDVLLKSSVINPHGLGVIWLDNWKKEVYESDDWEKLYTERPFVAHFRYATVGGISPDNVHPFEITKGVYLFQNGSVFNLGSTYETDTQHMARILAATDRKFWRDILEMDISRWVIVDTNKKNVEIYNRNAFTNKYKALWSKDNVLTSELLAVYGTLKRGGSNFNYYLSYKEFIEEGETVNRYPMIVNGIPYVKSKKGIGGAGHHIKVDVFLVKKDDLKDIDNLEGHPVWYKRMKTDIKLKSGVVVPAYLYFNDGVEDTGIYTDNFETYKKVNNDYNHYNTYDDYYDSYDNYSDYYLPESDKKKEKPFDIEHETVKDKDGDTILCPYCYSDKIEDLRDHNGTLMCMDCLSEFTEDEAFKEIIN